LGQHSWDPARTGGCVAAQKAVPSTGEACVGERVKPERAARLAARRDGGGREAGGGRAEGVAPSLRRLARPSERNGNDGLG
jgi:hypothetical protein